MYYGYNDNRELILADEAFIEILGYGSFQELRRSNIINQLKFENDQIVITQDEQIIHSDFLHHEVFSLDQSFYLVQLENVTIEKREQSAQKSKTQAINTNYQAIYLDVEKISSEIGLSVNDYKLYLDSFIDQSIIDEKRLLDGNDKVVKNLSNLALTLKIPQINILLLKIQKLSKRERMPLIDEYYTKLALLTLEKPANYKDSEVDELLEADHQSGEDKEEILSARFSDLLKNVDEKKEVKSESMNEEFIDEFDNFELDELIETPKSSKEVQQISLDNVPALPISYSPHVAADELNLPVVLIEEFVDDFIEQARQDKDHLLTSYYQHDMDNIHELGHKLKGAASNLRINELSDILEEIQFCTNHEELEGLFIKYWGHFLSLENYMKQLKRA
ncbi:MAG TPA: Hpt domain-containing protein [Campylobacterales bacterium]|nr:Hpt domain-containing protein [Campylobacterales bacterium]